MDHLGVRVRQGHTDLLVTEVLRVCLVPQDLSVVVDFKVLKEKEGSPALLERKDLMVLLV